MVSAITLLLSAASMGLPNYHVWGCYNISKNYPFCNPSLNISDRVEDVMGRMTYDEMIGMMSSYEPNTLNSCADVDAGVPRLGIPPYMHLVEVNTVITAACLAVDRCATTFPASAGFAASFNRTLWNLKGQALSDEMRAFNNLNGYRDIDPNPEQYGIGLTGFGPNINIMRDPRWGRNSEVPSEDPFLAGTYAAEYVMGGQVGDDKRYLKMAMSLKHYSVYSVETNRGAFIPNVTMHDLWETFLAQFEIAFTQGKASGTMCSYSGANGVNSCADEYLINQVLRQNFSSPDAIVASDCGAFGNMLTQSHTASSPLDVSTKTLFAGTDAELGEQYPFWGSANAGGQDGINQAISEYGPKAKNALEASIRRQMKLRMSLGLFDPVEIQNYTKIGIEVVNSTAHQQLNLEAAEQSLVLLKNDKNILPLTGQRDLALIGPHTVAKQDILSGYSRLEMTCWNNTYDCLPTMSDIFTEQYTSGKVTTTPGCDVNSMDTSQFGAAIQASLAADTIIFFMGLGVEVEAEGTDRTTVTLPGMQSELFGAIKEANPGKPIVLVVFGGGAVSLGNIIDQCDAIINAFYPGVAGAQAVFNTMVKGTNKFGKLPYTIMPAEAVYQLDMNDFNMSKPPGRTYKYFQGTPEFPFGYGLSYTTFTVSCSSTYSVKVTNTGTRDGFETVLVFHSVSDAIRRQANHPIPIKSLIGFERIFLKAQESYTITFSFQKNDFATVTADGTKRVYSGEHFLNYSTGTDSCSATISL
eukprot:TRINITY_DN138_c0_g2_i1.p1 TRINITY_DN138_c0_g2~~TRINITY_DN138_c0_g2_i1.p1  ORF type:complete len:752 (+),score=249.86 TRINITY_DN138_c0_g2_i1:57-2312(+)